MPLPATTFWRIMQLVAIFWCIILSIGVVLGGYWTVYNHESKLHLVLELGKKHGPSAKLVLFVNVVLMGSLGVTVIAVVFGIMASFVILLERRWLTITFTVMVSLLFATAVSFSVLSFIGREKATDLTKQLFDRGVQYYAHFNPDGNDELNSMFRFIVDHVQMQKECCGSKAYSDYSSSFPNVTIKDPSKSGEQRLACICRNDSRMDCRLQHVPLSCCKKKSSIDPFCATAIFDSRSSSNCNSTSAFLVNRDNIHQRECKRDKVLDLAHIWLLFYYGVVNVGISFMTCVLLMMLSFFAWKTAPRKEAIKAEVQAAFQMDFLKAKRMIEEAKEPSMSEASRNRSMSQRLLDDFGTELPQRVSSERLAPRRDSYQMPPSEILSARRHGTSRRK